MRSITRGVLLAFAALMAAPAAGELGVGEAEAVVGRPLTPVSYAGVARRTSRRTTRYAMAYGGHGGYGGYGYGAATVTALPAGCARTTMSGVLYYGCGNAYYRPYYQGSTVVYRSVAVP